MPWCYIIKYIFLNIFFNIFLTALQGLKFFSQKRFLTEKFLLNIFKEFVWLAYQLLGSEAG